MHQRITYMYINFQHNRVSRSVKTVHTNILTKNCKLLKFATCNSNSENHSFQTCITRLRTFKPFEINRPHSYCATEHQSYFRERLTDGQTSPTTTISCFFSKREKILKISNASCRSKIYILHALYRNLQHCATNIIMNNIDLLCSVWKPFI